MIKQERKRCWRRILDTRDSLACCFWCWRGKSIWWWKRREGRVMTMSKESRGWSRGGGCEVHSWVDDCLPLDCLLFQSLLLYSSFLLYLKCNQEFFLATTVSCYQDVLTYSVHAFNYVNPYSTLMSPHICSRDFLRRCNLMSKHEHHEVSVWLQSHECITSLTETID